MSKVKASGHYWQGEPQHINERRADMGRDAVAVVAKQMGTYEGESAYLAAKDVVAYIMHYADRMGWDPYSLTRAAYDSYEGDFEDGPKVACRFGDDLSMGECEGWR